MRRVVVLLVLLSSALLGFSGGATAISECPPNSHPGWEHGSCVCDDGYHWESGACVENEPEPTPNPEPCRPSCLVQLF